MSSPFAAELAEVLGTVQRGGDFFAAGSVDLLPPRLEVDEVGQIALPLLPAQAAQVIAAAEQAPYGRGEATVIDPAVRRTWQIGPDRVRVSGDGWARTLAAMVTRAAEGLGVEGNVTASFYKLLVYDEGSFFVSHRDTEKQPGMFATLIVALPSRFAGGALVVRHQGREVQLDLAAADPAEAAFAAFYADCVHEVRPVTQGHRLILVYNLVHKGRGRAPGVPSHAPQQARLATLLEAWRETTAGDAPYKLVYPLEHAYTPAELAFAALKGPDAARASVLVAAAGAASFELHLALLTIEENGSADYADSYGSRRRQAVEEMFEVGEVYECITTLSEWQRPDGAAVALAETAVEQGEFSPPDIVATFSPDEQHFHEATGNEGASFERTYRRAALVLWPAERKAAVLMQAGLPAALAFLDDFVARGEAGEAAARQQALALAAHMVAHWPTHLTPTNKGPSEPVRLLAALTRLDDAALIERALTGIAAARHAATADNPALIEALGRLPPPRRVTAIEGFVAAMAEADAPACANLLAGAVARWPAEAAGLADAASRLVTALPADRGGAAAQIPWRWGAAFGPGIIVDLLAGLVPIGAGLAERAMAHVLASPRTYPLDEMLIPAMRRVPGQGAAVDVLRAACLAHVRARMSHPLMPPADWRRSATLPCTCPRCAELARFLADPARETWSFRAVEADRGHVEETIRRAACDVSTKTERSGRPYSLICTKTQASYQRAAKQRRQDTEDLARLTA